MTYLLGATASLPLLTLISLSKSSRIFTAKISETLKKLNPLSIMSTYTPAIYQSYNDDVDEKNMYIMNNKMHKHIEIMKKKETTGKIMKLRII